MNTNPRIRLGFRSLIRVGGSGKQAATGGRVEAGTAGAGTRTLMICPLFSAITRFNYLFRRMARGLELYACHCRKALTKSTGTQVSWYSYLLLWTLPFSPKQKPIRLERIYLIVRVKLCSSLSKHELNPFG